jgi:peroxiredoxin
MFKEKWLLLVAGMIFMATGCAKSTDEGVGTKEIPVTEDKDVPATQDAADDAATGDSATDPGATDEAATEPQASTGPAQVGDPAPAWEGLVGVDDANHSLSDLSLAKAVVVVFTCNSCPVAVAYQDRLKQIAADYKDKGVELVAINVNNIEPDRLPAMKERATEENFEFAYLYDPTQESARAYNATVTPHAFLLDGDRKIAYAGAIDDSQNADSVTKTYLRDAIDAVLAGEAPAVTTSKAVGCGIKYEDT